MEVKSITKNFYEVTSKVTRTCEDGMEKVVKDTIVVSAVSFSDAEKKATEFYEGEALEKVCAIKEAAYREYVKRTDVTPHFSFYKVTVGMITLNEVTGKEKTTKIAYLVDADSTKEAEDIINKMFDGTVIDYKVISIKETNVTDIVLD
mgnify:FL=1